MPCKCFSNELWFYFGFLCFASPTWWLVLAVRGVASGGVPPTLHRNWNSVKSVGKPGSQQQQLRHLGFLLGGSQADQLMLSKLGAGSIRVLKLHLEDAQLGLPLRGPGCGGSFNEIFMEGEPESQPGVSSSVFMVIFRTKHNFAF